MAAADNAALNGVRDVFNTAAVFQFGLDRATARPVNVDGALHVLRWAATRPGLRRLVHVSGYRVGLDPVPRYPLPDAELDTLYRDKGANDASKTESDAALRVADRQVAGPGRPAGRPSVPRCEGCWPARRWRYGWSPANAIRSCTAPVARP